MEKRYPEIGEHLYLSALSGGYYIRAVKDPYTVIGIQGGKVIVQAARPIFYGPRYFNTLADDIVEDPHGEVIALNWAPKIGKWKERGDIGRAATFGAWKYYPYLD